MMSDRPYIEDVMMAWRADGFSWEVIDKMRRSEPYNTYPRYTGSILYWKKFNDAKQKMIEAGYLKEK